MRRGSHWLAVSLMFSACSLFAPDRADLTGGSDTAGSGGTTAATGGGGGSLGASGGRGGLDAAAGSAGNGGTGASGTTGAAGDGGSVGLGGSAGSAGSLGAGGSLGGAGSNGSGGSAGAGGSSAGGGSGGAAGTGAAGQGLECTSAAHCRLHWDCCTCTGLARTEAEPDPSPSCPTTCAENACEQAGIAEPECLLGQCVAAFDCDLRVVTCGTPQPNCPSGTVPSRSGTCWGPCVDPSDCKTVGNCGACGAGQICVGYVDSTGTSYRCLPLPPRCITNRTCECLASHACPPIYSTCLNGPNSITCDCFLCP